MVESRGLAGTGVGTCRCVVDSFRHDIATEQGSRRGEPLGYGQLRQDTHKEAHQPQSRLGQLRLKQQQLRNPTGNANRDRLDSSQIIGCYLKRF